MDRMSLEFIGRVAVLKFNHPEVMNAVGGKMLEDFVEAIAQIKARGSETRCLPLSRGLGDVYKRQAVNGAAAGVGMSFAMMGDIVCASRQAYFLQAFARIGLIPDGGATFLLPRLVGWGRAMELSLLAERLPAEQAQEWGLVNRVYDDQEALMSGAMEVANRLANGPKSLSLIRKAYWKTWSNSYEQQLELESDLQNEAGQSSDFKEGVSAFLQKRDAQFQGQ